MRSVSPNNTCSCAVCFVWLVYKSQFLPYKGTQYYSVTQANRLMLYGDIIVVYWKNYMKHTNTVRGQNAEYLNLKAGSTQHLQCELLQCDVHKRFERVTVIYSSCQEQFATDIASALFICKKNFHLLFLHISHWSSVRSTGLWHVNITRRSEQV
jgi:hypothetical protein